jgi:ribosome assembly protein YihI (activator of Der GTPase)
MGKGEQKQKKKNKKKKEKERGGRHKVRRKEAVQQQQKQKDEEWRSSFVVPDGAMADRCRQMMQQQHPYLRNETKGK